MAIDARVTVLEALLARWLNDFDAYPSDPELMDDTRAALQPGGLMDTFQQALESLLNEWCEENESNTPDFILAQYMKGCLDAFNEAVRKREEWYGRDPKRGPGKDATSLGR